MPQVKTSFAKGTVVYPVQNVDLASCLIAVGIPLRNDPPYVYGKQENGDEVLVCMFHPHNEAKDLHTEELIAAFSQDMKFIEANPTHPFTFAMCSIKNRASILDHIKNDTPQIGFRGRGKGTLLVKEGSEKYHRCLAKGMRRTDIIKRA